MMQKVPEGFKLGHLETPHHITAENSKVIAQGGKEGLGVKLWSAFVNKSSKCCFMQKTQELQGRSNMLTNELCLLAELH